MLKKFLKAFKIMFKKRGEIKASLISSKELSSNELEEISKDYQNQWDQKLNLIIKLIKNLLGV